ncbi:site-specific recombinase XerD [Thermodesulfitimonas autotrophica]|uniref:Site-specific recombinase XerD n=1 Tax=Thermodesulfitimonas autotrophica TaxID=1894989 RepID=A0A3N5APR4_9THEO|nr:site-specific integrase [Thermodesulfitimonas autotrophica]RPF47109.1 site-specific recombinase XerD [Thermodesulfitimonas autotrophica]
MRGSIRRQAKDSWRITISLGKNPKTEKYEKYQETIRGKKANAEKRLAELIAQLEKGYTINPERITFGEFLDKWLADYGRSNLSERTLYDYTHIINYHVKPELGDIPLVKLHPAHLREFYGKLLREGRKDNKRSVGPGLSPAYVRKVHVIIHEALKHAVRWELAYRNVADAVDPPKVTRQEIRPLTERELDRLFGAVKDSYLYVPTCIAVATGLRLGEVLALRWEDVDLKHGVITVKRAQKVRRQKTENGTTYEITYGPPKSKNSKRSVEIPPSLVELLKHHRLAQKKDKLFFGAAYQDNGLVCCLQDGRPIRNESFGSHFRDVAHKAGLKISFHSLRHCHASWLVRMGESLKVVSARLGHSGIGITADYYAHLFPDAQKEAAKKVDSLLADKLT